MASPWMGPALPIHKACSAHRRCAAATHQNCLRVAGSALPPPFEGVPRVRHYYKAAKLAGSRWSRASPPCSYEHGRGHEPPPPCRCEPPSPDHHARILMCIYIHWLWLVPGSYSHMGPHEQLWARLH